MRGAYAGERGCTVLGLNEESLRGGERVLGHRHQ